MSSRWSHGNLVSGDRTSVGCFARPELVTLFVVANLGLTPSRAQTTHTVELMGLDFVPADLTVEVGDTIHWVWVSGFHNVESGVVKHFSGLHDGNFRSGDPTDAVGTTFDLLFDQAFLDAHPMPGNG